MTPCLNPLSVSLSFHLSFLSTKSLYFSGQKLYDLAYTNTRDDTRQQSVVYSIPCGSCSLVYYGEMARGMKRRIKEHRSYLRHHRTTNSLVLHAEKHGHLPRWENVVALHKIRKKEEEAGGSCIHCYLLSHQP